MRITDKTQVIDLIQQVTAISVKTIKIIRQMEKE